MTIKRASERMTGAQAIIATLQTYHVDTLFGIPGVHTLPLYDIISRQPALRHILARHEQGVGFMAEGYARASGRPGVALTITGPGVTNIATPVASAYSDSIPLLVISTSLPRSSTGRPRGELHEIKNQLGVMESLAGWARAVESVEEIPGALQDAFRVMRQGRARGAYLQVPLDLLEITASIEILEPPEIEPLRPDPTAITTAAQKLLEAKRPLIVAGAGVTAAGANGLLAELATLLAAPVLLGSKSHDVLPSDHPLVMTSTGYISPELHELVSHADVALVVGSKLGSERTGAGRLPLPRTLIQIDLDPVEIGRNYPASLPIVADAHAALEALLTAVHNALPEASKPQTDQASAVALVKETQRLFTFQRRGESVRFLDGLRAALPHDGIVVADMTMLGYGSAQYLPVYEPRTFIHPYELCTIGCGLPLALGAKVAQPQRPVVALCGDGGFLLNAGELATAVQEQIPVIIVLFNDSTYTAVKTDQKRRFGRYIATDLVAPDYVALAQAFHAQSERVATPDELSAAICGALKNSGPTLIEVMLPRREW